MSELPAAEVTSVSSLVQAQVKLSRVIRSPKVKALEQDIANLVLKYGGMDSGKKLAVAAHVTGRFLSLIDDKTPPLKADAIISTNISTGVRDGLKAQGKLK